MSWAMSASLAGQRQPWEFFLPSASVMTWADATTWSGVFSMGVPCTKFRAVVLVKNLLVGASTGNYVPYLTLEAGATAAMTGNQIVDVRPLYLQDGQLGVATSRIYHVTLQGALLNTAMSYAAVYFRTPTSNANFASVGAATFDGQIDCT